MGVRPLASLSASGFDGHVACTHPARFVANDLDGLAQPVAIFVGVVLLFSARLVVMKVLFRFFFARLGRPASFVGDFGVGGSRVPEVVSEFSASKVLDVPAAAWEE